MLYIVPTPIGNLEDMPARALRALREVKAVYCEDTRRTRALMSHFGITVPLLRYNEHNRRAAEEIVGRLKGGLDAALVSDSGLPAISDPGRALVELARRSGIRVTALPGPSAVTTALAGSGLPADSFVFLGFLPRSPGKQRRVLQEAAALKRTIVIYESPYRVLALLERVEQVLGAAAQACVARELSKVHEEWLSGTVSEMRRELGSRRELLGEFVLVFHPEEAPA
ncbi:MAG: 16S rRNA (cytidine(1402)-2'-O)-methyltransferase [Elusimicrobia bacterium]|nr:16S rRNA (cytidine(1402)-2'-O)-methyltransferase [Elusimicrobiota bacterium]